MSRKHRRNLSRRHKTSQRPSVSGKKQQWPSPSSAAGVGAGATGAAGRGVGAGVVSGAPHQSVRRFELVFEIHSSSVSQFGWLTHLMLSRFVFETRRHLKR